MTRRQAHLGKKGGGFVFSWDFCLISSFVVPQAQALGEATVDGDGQRAACLRWSTFARNMRQVANIYGFVVCIIWIYLDQRFKMTNLEMIVSFCHESILKHAYFDICAS